MARNWGSRTAAELRAQLELSPGNVDVFAVTRELGIETYLRSMPGEGLDGAHQLVEDTGFIFINSAHAVTRQRFTAAHELGHHRHGIGQGPPVFESDVVRLTDPTEVDINSFAAHFLMDPPGMRTLVSEIDDPLQRVAAVGSRFAVSPEAAAIHLATLGSVTHAFKIEVCRQLREKELRPGDLYRRYSYEPTITPDALDQALDPNHVARAVRAYDLGLMNLAGLSDALGVSSDEAAAILRRSDIEVSEESEDPAALAR